MDNISSRRSTLIFIYLIAVYFGLILCCISWGLGLIVGARVRGVVVHGASPVLQADTCGFRCCGPSMPTIQGCLWTGVWLCLLALSWTQYAQRDDSLPAQRTPGAVLMGFSVACLFFSAILYSVTACCTLGPLPGVGTGAANCCCVERNINRLPPEAARVAPALHLATPAQPLGKASPPPADERGRGGRCDV